MVQVELFQTLVSDGTGIKQVDLDSARSSLQNSVNSYLASITPPSFVLDVQFKETTITSDSLLLTAEVTYRSP